MKRSLFILIAITFSLHASFSNTITLTEQGGWLETAYVKWLPVEGADFYQVYVTGEGLTDKKIDTQLIREYADYFRADIPGLKAGSYTVKVEALQEETVIKSAISNEITVHPIERVGFAFSNNIVPGAYKIDGTPKDNAYIIYITENTKNTISMDVTGANSNPCVGLQAILDGFKKGKDNRPLIVRLIGQITDPKDLDKGDIVIENKNNALSYITIEGIGDDAVVDGWGIRVKNANNIEIRNLGLMNCDSGEGDNIGLQQNNYHVWVHHCDFFYGHAGSDADQAKGDGALDSKGTGNATFDYNHFWDTGKSNLLGMGEDPEYITYHHNWYDHSDSRHPRVRRHSVHVFNNYFDGISKYGVGATTGSSIFVEANYFRNCKYPMLISMQGSDVYDESKQKNDYSNKPTFSKEDGGIIKAYNNYINGGKRFVPYADGNFPNSTVDFDAYVATTRTEIVPSNITSYRGNNSYNNFDTNVSIMYAYAVDSPEDAKAKVTEYAGRMHGGDFKWTFNDAVDDSSYDVNTALKAALVNYTTQLVAVQGEDVDNNQGNNNNGNDNPDAMTHNFTLYGTNSTFYSINGSLSSTKGTVEYAGLTLTQCLKIESATNVSFTTDTEYILTLVFNDNFNGKIKINGTNYSATSGILTTTLPAGSYSITKGDTSNLYYISLQKDMTSVVNPEKNIQISIYPNPASHTLHISTDNRIHQIKVFSLTGELVLTKTGDNVHIIQVDYLNKGAYILQIQTAQGLVNRRFLKE